MICHVCKKEASGQCKECLRFYCPDHGNRKCVECQGLANEPAPERPAPPPEPAFRIPNVAYQGPTCYACSRPAHRACTRCGSFFCEEHGPMTCGSECQGCSTFNTVWGVIVLVIFAIGFLVFVANR